MSSVVLDASFIVKLFVEESGSRLAQSVLEAYEAGGHRLIAPAHAFAEVGAVFCRKVRLGAMEERQFEAALSAMTKRIDLHAIDGLIGPAARLALQAGVSVYDTLYLVLAERAGAVFLTADRKLCEAMKESLYAPLILAVDAAGLISYGEP